MRVGNNEPFHINCRHTKRSICYCIEGTPPGLRDPSAAKEYSENAKRLNEFWQRPAEALFYNTDAVDVIVPRLLRRERIPASPPEVPAGPSLSQQLEEAQGKAQHAAMMAASLAARGGLLYRPPPGIDIKDFLKQIVMQDQTKLEEAVEQVLRNRSAIARATAAVGKTAAAAEREMKVPVNDTILIPQQQHHHIITATTQVPQHLSMRFPQEFRRGPRRRAPLKAWRLTLAHHTPNLIGKLIQILVKSPKEWHPALVSGLNPVDGNALLVFESDMQRVVHLKSLIENDEVAWLNKETADEQNSGAGGGAGSSKKKRGAAIMKASAHSKYQRISPITSSVDGGDSIDIAAGTAGTICGGAGMSGGGGYSGIGATGAAAAVGVSAVDTKETAATASASAGMEEDEEQLVLARLKGVTKRQRAVAAKKVANAKTSPDSKIRDTEAVVGARAVERSGSGADAAFPGIRHDQQQQQTSLPLPPGFIPVDRDANVPINNHASIPIANAASYEAIIQQQQQYHQQVQQQQQSILSNVSAGTASLVMPHIFQLGDGIMRGKAIQLTISDTKLAALVLKLDKEKQSMLIVVQGRPVMLKAEDEGIKYQLAFI